MRGNTGVHFEDVGYAVTNTTKFVSNLKKAGYTKVAATGLGSFTQYEEVKNIAAMLNESSDSRLDIIPAVKCFYKSPEDTLTLIAKDHEGYLSLCKIITESNALGTVIEHSKNISKNNPIVHEENLRKNVAKGHLAVLHTNNNGYLSNQYAKINTLQQRIEHLEEILTNIPLGNGVTGSYEDCMNIIGYYNHMSSFKRPLKKELDMAQKFYEKTGDRSDLDILERKQKEYETGNAFKKTYEDTVESIKKAAKSFQKTYTEYIETKAELEEIDLESLKAFIKDEYKKLEDIFGRENTGFELQYHGEEDEATLRDLISIANQVGNGNFVIGNGSRIGTTKDADDMEEELLRLNVAMINHDDDKNYIPLTNEREFCIKTEEDYKEEMLPVLKKIIPSAESFFEDAIKRTDTFMSQCFMEEKEMTNHYPKYCEDENAEIRKRCYDNIAWRYPDGMSKDRYERLERELDVITSMGYSGYHLIVQDYLEYGRLLGYLNEDEVEDAPLTIEELNQHLTETNNPRIGVGIGPGRGSAAGSIVCYLLGITDMDPVENGLLFERFLNPERVSMPDIDSDFRPQVRLKAREYVKHKYGAENVCEIVTKAYQKESGCIHIAARYLAAKEIADKGLEDKDKAEVKSMKQHWESVGKAIAKDYQKFIKSEEGDEKEYFIAFCQKRIFNAEEQQIIDMIPVIKGLFTGYSQHAAGVIISKDSVGAELPLMWNSTAQSMQTQCQMASAEEKGYLKMDFLGLRNLAIITDVVKNPSNKEDVTDICQDTVKRKKYIIDNPEVYKQVFCTGSTQGVFQFESEGMKQMLINFQPETFDDIVLLVAAYRPGPMDYIPEIIAQKWYKKDPEHYEEIISKMYPPTTYDPISKQNVPSEYTHLYPTPKSSISLKNETLDNILKTTYGCPIYQEQIMQIFQEMAGYSLGRADEVRRAMSKKKVDKLAHEKENFIYGNEKEIVAAKEKLESLKRSLDTAPENEKTSIRKQIETFKIPKPIDGCIKKHGITVEEADDLFEQMMPFAKYGFNKSHAAAYATVAAETAWLKVYRTADFYCSALNNWKKRDELPKYVADMEPFNIKLLPPSIECKSSQFTVENGNIRFPIKKAKNVSFDVDSLVASNSLQGFIQANPGVTKTVVDTLVSLGCFDACWKFSSEKMNQTEIKRTNHSITAQHKWVKENYTPVSKFVALKNELETAALTDTQRATKETQYEALKQDLNERVKADYKDKKIIKRLNIDILEERKKEYDLTGHIFSIEEELAHLKEYNNSNTFEVLKDTKESFVPIPCIILSVGEEGATKSGKPFISVTLMDAEGSIIERRFNTNLKPMIEEKITRDGKVLPASRQLYGIYNISANKYYVCDERMVPDKAQVKKRDQVKAGIRQLQEGMDSREAFPTQNPMIENQTKYYESDERSL